MYIYTPAGKAREYGELALNLYTGCPHGCKYCYVPQATKTDRAKFHATPDRRDIDEFVLDREIDRLWLSQSKIQNPKSKIPFVFLCFTCDPYQPLEEEHRITRRIIKKLHRHGLGVTILTKAGFASTRDFDLLAENPHLSSYGATLTFLNMQSSALWEPAAAQPEDRLQALKLAHYLGIPTWASLEPVLDPYQSLEIIRRTHEYVDLFKVGKWNHDARANAIDWPAFAREAVALLESLGKKYYIKEDLRRYLEPGHAASAPPVSDEKVSEIML